MCTVRYRVRCRMRMQVCGCRRAISSERVGALRETSRPSTEIRMKSIASQSYISWAPDSCRDGNLYFPHSLSACDRSRFNRSQKAAAARNAIQRVVASAVKRLNPEAWRTAAKTTSFTQFGAAARIHHVGIRVVANSVSDTWIELHFYEFLALSPKKARATLHSCGVCKRSHCFPANVP